jgi:hypothetical protein
MKVRYSSSELVGENYEDVIYNLQIFVFFHVIRRKALHEYAEMRIIIHEAWEGI